MPLFTRYYCQNIFEPIVCKNVSSYFCWDILQPHQICVSVCNFNFCPSGYSKTVFHCVHVLFGIYVSFLRADLGLTNDWSENSEFPLSPILLWFHSVFLLFISCIGQCFCYSWWGFILYVHFRGFNKYIIKSVHLYSIIQNNFSF